MINTVKVGICDVIKTVNVGISDMKISSAPNKIVTYALGSCVGVCIIDKVVKVAGMVHIMLPNSKDSLTNNIHVFKYANTGVEEMVRQMTIRGCSKNRMVAKIAGGAKMFDIKNENNSSIGNIGQRNIIAVKDVLKSLYIDIVAEDVGLNYGRTIYFDCGTGELLVKSFAKGDKVI